MLLSIFIYTILSIILIYIIHQMLIFFINKYTEPKILDLDGSKREEEYMKVYNIISKQKKEKEKQTNDLKSKLKNYMLDLEENDTKEDIE